MLRNDLPHDRARRIFRQVRRVVARHRTCHAAGSCLVISIPSNGALLRAPCARTQAAMRARPASRGVCGRMPNTRCAFS
jgi:hypothetical protein